MVTATKMMQTPIPRDVFLFRSLLSEAHFD